jgi:hypothetical protein
MFKYFMHWAASATFSSCKLPKSHRWYDILSKTLCICVALDVMFLILWFHCVPNVCIRLEQSLLCWQIDLEHRASPNRWSMIHISDRCLLCRKRATDPTVFTCKQSMSLSG